MMNMFELNIKVERNSLVEEEKLKKIIKEVEEIQKEHPDIKINIEVHR